MIQFSAVSMLCSSRMKVLVPFGQCGGFACKWSCGAELELLGVVDIPAIEPLAKCY
jgi:hypothetical protein